MNLDEKDYIVGMATTVKPDACRRPHPRKIPADAGVPKSKTSARKARSFSPSPKTDTASAPPPTNTACTNRGGKGVINVKTTERNGKVVGIAQVTENSEVMLISQYGKIIRIESKFIRESGRSAQGVRLLNIEAGDRVAAAVVIPPEEEPTNGGTLIQ